MLKSLKNELNTAFTENGAVTYATTGSDCLDLFATVGALRNAQNAEIVKRFISAFTESPDTAMKILFYARDVRGGLGERRVFRVILDWLCRNEPKSVIKNIENIAKYGRYDDLLTLIGTPCEQAAMTLISERLHADMEALENGGEVSLLAKWLPSVNASDRETVILAKQVARHLEMSEASYRKTLSKLRAHIRIIENSLRERDYTFDYSKQPSKAMFKYREAFMRNDGERYREYLGRVSSGEEKMNTAVLYPYELVAPYLGWQYYTQENPTCMKKIDGDENNTLNATWEALPDFTGDENALAVVDTSGSMYNGSRILPAHVALSLGIYFAEHNKGAFHNHFIEFSSAPRLIEIKGETFADKLRYIASFCEVANTDIEAVFDVILEAAVKNNLSQTELPSSLYIISDMEFDCCVENASKTNFENARSRFEAAGYYLPRVVFWNVASRRKNQPVTKNEEGVTLVSGCSPRIFSMTASGRLSPYEYMMDVIGGERYSGISA